MNPELVIVGVVLLVVVVALVLAWMARGGVLAKREEMRRSTVVEVPVVSPGRVAAVFVPAILLPPALWLGTLLALDTTHAHALLAVGGTLVVTMLSIAVASFVAPRVSVVGRLRLAAHQLTFERGADTIEVDLRAPFELREAIVLPDRYSNGGRVETVVVVVRGDEQLAFRYPCLVGETPLAPDGVVAPPRTGTAVDSAARVLHERLRALREAR